MAMMKPSSALVVDSDRKFLDSMREDPKARMAPPVLAECGKDAQLALADTSRRYAGVFVNINLPDGYGLSVIRFSHQFRPATPIYLIHDDEKPPLSEEQLRQLAIQKALHKPVTYTQLMALVSPTVTIFDEKALSNQSGAEDAVGAEMAAEDATFLPIRAENFLSGAKSFFNVYVKLAGGKYVKILHAGDAFAADRVGGYIAKGVTHFYLKKDAQEHYLAYCDKIATAVLKSDKISKEAKISQTLNHGEETMSFLRNHGLSETNLQYAQSFTQNVQELVKQLDVKKSDLLSLFLADVSSYEHGISTSMISALLLPALDFKSDKSVQIVGLSSMVHDIGLYKLPPEVQDEDESRMTPEQKAQYYTHPAIGAQAMRSIRGVEPTVPQAIAQHHERRNKKGFPTRGGSGGAINRVAEIIGIADEFVRLMKKSKQLPDFNPFEHMKSDVFDGFSYPVVEVFRMVFLAKSLKG